MEKLYQILRGINPCSRNVVCTVIAGEHFGKKGLFSDGRLLWESEENGYFSANQAKFSVIDETKTLLLDSEKIFAELIGSEKKIVICGGGHVSIPIIRMGLMMGYHITVLEDRPKFADDARAAGAQEVICDAFDRGLEQVDGDTDTFFVIVTRGHRFDQLCLKSIAKKEHAYIGMIGSKLRVKKVLEVLEEEGGDSEVLSHVHTPIGLAIGAETPEEIAVSIMAEIIQVKNEKSKGSGYPKKILRAILDDASSAKMMTTIVSRKGSAPRAVGTKMLVYPDGTCVGTIGGGCVEADVTRKAMRMMTTNKTEPQIYKVDMTGADAEDEGMVCGGVVEILFERV